MLSKRSGGVQGGISIQRSSMHLSTELTLKLFRQRPTTLLGYRVYVVLSFAALILFPRRRIERLFACRLELSRLLPDTSLLCLMVPVHPALSVAMFRLKKDNGAKGQPQSHDCKLKIHSPIGVGAEEARLRHQSWTSQCVIVAGAKKMANFSLSRVPLYVFNLFLQSFNYPANAHSDTTSASLLSA